MTDAFDPTGLQDICRTSIITTSMVIKHCISSRFTQNIEYLENNECNVNKLGLYLDTQITEAEEFIGGASIISSLDISSRGTMPDTDTRALFGFIHKFSEENQAPPSFRDLLDFIVEAHKVSQAFEDILFSLNSSGYLHSAPKTNARTKYKVIDKHCTDLVEKAKRNKLDPLIGREKEIARMIEVLAHYKKKNPLLVGEAGTGKTAIVEGLASAIAQDRVPEAIKGAKIFSTSIAQLMAGTKFRGDVEEKVSELLKELAQHEKDTGLQTYLFIDEVHQIVGAGNNGSGGGSDIANIIKPALAGGELALIGATTSKEYKKSIQSDSALDRRFQTLKVEPPTDAETIEILKKGIAPVLTLHHGVKYPLPIIKRAVELSSKYITNKAQPDKSISLLDSIGARLRTTEQRTTARVSDVEKLVAAITGTPVTAFKQKVDKDTYIDIEAKLNEVVFGQAEATAKITEIYERSKAGLSEEGQPIGSALLIGPTGVGKTEVANSLAKITESHFFKINMGEYTEEHSVAKLFGAPPGYVGHKEGGLLTNEITKYPHTVLLLDEVEKAHKKVFESLLGIIDGAKMTDGEGNTVDFSNVFILATSNVGASSAALKKAPLGLIGGAELETKAKAKVSEKALKQTFSPEFRNKLSAVINFNALGTSEIRLVTDKFLKKAQDKLKERKDINIEFTEEVYDYINKNGFDPAFGARPIARLVTELIVDSLVKPILKGEVKKGDNIKFDVAEDKVVFTVKETVEV